MNRLYDERRELSVLKPINEFLDPQSKLIVMHCARGEKKEKLRALNRGDLLVCDLTEERKTWRDLPAEYKRSRLIGWTAAPLIEGLPTYVDDFSLSFHVNAALTHHDMEIKAEKAAQAAKAAARDEAKRQRRMEKQRQSQRRRSIW